MLVCEVNKKKYHYFQESLEMIAFLFSNNGLHKSSKKVKVMLEAPRSEDAKQLDSFLELIVHYVKFIPIRAEKLQPLYEFINEEKFV